MLIRIGNEDHYFFNFKFGDISEDGHNQHRNYLIHSNLPFQEFVQCFKSIPEKTGIDLYTFCDEYEDAVIPLSVIKVLTDKYNLSKDFICDHFFYYNEYENKWEADGFDSYMEFILFLITKVNPNFKFYETDEVIETMRVYIGYGLF